MSTPVEIAEQLRQTFGAPDAADRFAALFADDGVYELPFAPPGMPARLVGKEAIHAGMSEHAARARRLLDIQGADLVTYESAEPGVITVEFTAYGTFAGSGAPFRFPSSVGVIRVRDGKIASYRDYPNVTGARTRTAREVADHFLEVSARGAYDELADLYAEDAVIEIPYAPPGVPRTSQGREVFRARFKSVEPLWEITGIDPATVHETGDPSVVVLEFTLHRRLIASGEALTSDYVVIMTVRDGLIVRSRDYADPLAGAKSLGRLEDLVSAYAGEESIAR